jgi:hypothetical protein
MMIVVLWATLLTAGARGAIQWDLVGDSPEMACMGSACMISASFLGEIQFSLQDPVCYYLTGRPPMTSSHPMPITCQWYSRLARPLDRRSAPRPDLILHDVRVEVEGEAARQRQHRAA